MLEYKQYNIFHFSVLSPSFTEVYFWWSGSANTEWHLLERIISLNIQTRDTMGSNVLYTYRSPMNTISVHVDCQQLKGVGSDPSISQNEMWTETWTFSAAKLEKSNTIGAHFLHWIDWNDLKLIHPLTFMRICMTQSVVPVRNLQWSCL